MRVRFGECVLDSETRQLSVGGDDRPHAAQGVPVPRAPSREPAQSPLEEQIHEKLWPGTFISDSTLTSLLVEVRDVIGDEARHPLYVRTVHRFGYAFCGRRRGGERRGRAGPARRWSCWVLQRGKRTALAPGETLIGRDPAAVLLIDDPSVSRRHARILVADGSATLEDLGSKNGTHLDDRKVESAGRPGGRRPHRRRHGRADVPHAADAPLDRDRRRVLIVLRDTARARTPSIDTRTASGDT